MAETNLWYEPDDQVNAFDTYSPPWTLFVIPSLVSDCIVRDSVMWTDAICGIGLNLVTF